METEVVQVAGVAAAVTTNRGHLELVILVEVEEPVTVRVVEDEDVVDTEDREERVAVKDVAAAAVVVAAIRTREPLRHQLNLLLLQPLQAAMESGELILDILDTGLLSMLSLDSILSLPKHSTYPLNSMEASCVSSISILLKVMIHSSYSFLMNGVICHTFSARSSGVSGNDDDDDVMGRKVV